MRIWLCSWIVVSVVALGAGACSSSNKSSGGSGGTGGGTGGSAGVAGGSGSGGASGSGGTSGSGGADGGSCHGDATKWAARSSATCTKNSDCCVVINPCVNQAQVVSKQDYDNGIAAQWPYCENQCTACIAPAVDVVCDSGTCGLIQLDPMDASSDKRTDHCGVDTTPVVGTIKPLLGCP